MPMGTRYNPTYNKGGLKPELLLRTNGTVRAADA